MIVRSITRKTLVVGEKDRAEILRHCNRLLRGIRSPQRCTCPQDHGWHT